jgi:polyhydroxyalkanoate synthase
MADTLDAPERLRNVLRMEKSHFASPDQAGEAFRPFRKYFDQQNRLINGNLEIGGRPVRLENVTMPVFNLYATADHLVPPSASRPLEKYVGTKDYTTFEFKGGHIGIYVSGRAQREIPPTVAAWLKERS